MQSTSLEKLDLVACPAQNTMPPALQDQLSEQGCCWHETVSFASMSCFMCPPLDDFYACFLSQAELFPSALCPDEQIVAALFESKRASDEHIQREQASSPQCQHVHLELWSGADPPWHCYRCKEAITDAGRLSHEEHEAAKVLCDAPLLCTSCL